MSEFTRKIVAYPSYDYRDDPQPSKGACGVRIWFVLAGPDGAIAWELITGWMANAIDDPSWSIYAGRPPVRTGSPGVDSIGAKSVRQPTAGPISSHSPVKLRDYWGGPYKCEWIDGEECYGDAGYTAGDRAFRALTEGGSEAVFTVLEEFYRAWIEGEDE